MHAPDRHELNAGWTLPEAYGIDRLVLLPKNPHTLFVYWEITPGLNQKMQEQHGHSWGKGTLIIRLHDLDMRTNQDMEINHDADNWYISVDAADRTYYVELGRMLPDGRFISMLTSNTVRTPRDSISAVIDPRWRMFAFWQERYHRQIPNLSSFALFSREGQLDAEEAKYVD
ncbi:DUF4912 domain-containing protein [Dethiobacter alkaliphilus]|uniref:DUF4912 domain-containing protein n=1 Tax=Dethiobacter alkaliphilus TaxID=427926 RepID=UPI002226FC0B|nr:DUF4912 domain-containing protein [Dethiobacter alkaliphilus]MCW3489306.1 DUF4912 domain-containing protein [Dethiobacter alkaliphilus]